MIKNKKLLLILSAVIIALSLSASLIGVFSSKPITVQSVNTAYGETVELYQKGLYARDSVSAATQAKAQDVVTLIIGIPALLVSILLVSHNSKKGLFLLAGTIGYFLYTYASYSFMAVYNVLYLIYIIILIAAFYAFVVCINSLREGIHWENVAEHYPRKLIGIFFPFAGFIICMMWLGRILPTIPTGNAPYGLEHYSTLVIQSLDLGFIVPACFVTGYFLLKKNSWGYLLSIVLLVKLVALAAAVSTMAVSMYVSGVEMNPAELFVFPAFAFFGVVLMWKVLHSIDERKI